MPSTAKAHVWTASFEELAELAIGHGIVTNETATQVRLLVGGGD
jgi:hypothetical protein